MSAQPLSKQLQKLNEDIKLFPQVTPIDTFHCVTEFKGVSRLVMLDRYSFKDTKKLTLSVGDLVVLTYKDDPKFPRRGYGFVKKLDFAAKTVTVQLDNQFEDGLIVETVFDKIDKPLELFYEQIADRVARGLASVEDTPEKYQQAHQAFYNQLVDKNLVPAGRVLMGAGSGKGITFFNCYVMPMVHDSRGGIGEHRKQVMEIMSRGGGVGTNGSTLRPRDAYCHGVNGRSSGAVTWLNDLSSLTNLVEQGGSRRGAQMIMMASWHPDVVEFIISKIQNPDVLRKIIQETNSDLIRKEAERKLKFTPLKNYEEVIFREAIIGYNRAQEKGYEFLPDQVAAYKHAKKMLSDGGIYDVHQPDFLTGANISVLLTDDFMDAVNSDGDYALQFPDLENYSDDLRADYDTEWHEVGDVREWEKKGYPVRTYHTIKAKDLWTLINVCATYSAEPGVFFIDNANDKTNAVSYDMKVVATNPCGEQPLAPWSVCNLSAVNLAQMTKDGQVDFAKLKNTVRTAIHMQDNVIDATPYFLEENTKQAKGERRIGLGVMGLHDLLIRCEKVYGSPEGNDIVNQVFETMATTAYEASIDLAREKGSFPFLEVLPNGEPNTNGREKFINSGFMKTMPEHIRQNILKYGIRNSHLLTVAPTGSTGTMMNVSTGLEPYFSFVYYRSGRLGQFIPVIADIAVEWLEANDFVVTEDNVFELVNELPEHFNGSMTLSPEAHADVQCIIQRWVDSSISKTVNAPRGYTVAQVQAVYERLHKGGAKGGTVYVDGSRDAQVLSLTNEENTFDNVDVSELVAASEDSNQITAEQVANALMDMTVNNIADDKNLGTDIGDICPVCTIGTVIEQGGCHTCDNCKAQLVCGL